MKMAGDTPKRHKYNIELEVAANLKAFYSMLFNSNNKIVNHTLFDDYMEIYLVNNNPILPELIGAVNKIRIYYEFDMQ